MNKEMAIDAFSKKFNSIDNLDYGDFMRRANLYLIELDEQIHKNKEITNLMKQMKNEIQYNPNWDIQATRNSIGNLVKTINQIQTK